jgi:hypothetical protein
LGEAVGKFGFGLVAEFEENELHDVAGFVQTAKEPLGIAQQSSFVLVEGVEDPLAVVGITVHIWRSRWPGETKCVVCRSSPLSAAPKIKRASRRFVTAVANNFRKMAGIVGETAGFVRGTAT